MCMYIGIEDLAANALIWLLRMKQQSGGQLFIRFSVLLDYGMAVIKKLKKDGEEATLIYSRDATSLLFSDYSDFFEEATDADGWSGIKLRDNKTMTDLCLKFIAPIPVKVQAVMSDGKILEKYLRKVA